jgi:hypothetical protein
MATKYNPFSQPNIITLTASLQNTFTESNYRLFFGLALDVLLRPWEKIVMGSKFTEVYFVLFQQGTFTEVTTGSWVQFVSTAI